MKKIIILFIGLLLIRCSTPQLPQDTDKLTFPARAAASVVYEVNIRQYTPEGTLNAFAQHLPRLQELGVDMLWIMPVQPIGQKNRKGSLGSYYSISDYSTVNPEFGTMEDFKALVQKAHNLDMTVILDWVPNHTAWDHPWITEHKDYYALDSAGNVTYEADWTDIALLDHTNPATRRAMIDEMKKWVVETDIDGFRCDHAGHEIPLYFWEEATAELNPLRDLFWLAEWDEPRMHLTFHSTYSWELLHLTEDIAQGEKNANDLDQFIQKDLALFGANPFRMTITTNHDENSWAGTVFERYGQGHQTFATLIFTAYGFPMIYSGQEVGLDKRLAFFEKDSIDWSDPEQLTSFYQKLISIKKNNAALHNGGFGGMPARINNDKWVYGFKREKEGNSVIGILNLSGEEQIFNLTDVSIEGSYQNAFSNKKIDLSIQRPMVLKPWEYLIFETNTKK